MQQDEKNAIFKIVNISKKISYTDHQLLALIEKEFSQDFIFSTSGFGHRFLRRIKHLLDNDVDNDTCILCAKNKADNQVVCKVCLSNLGDKVSEFDAEVDEVLNKYKPNKTAGTSIFGKNIKGNKTSSTKEPISEATTQVDDELKQMVAESSEELQKKDLPNTALPESDNVMEDSKNMDWYTADLIRNIDASMDKLASRKSVKTSNRMLMAILVICLINTISIIAIAVMVFQKLNLS